MDLMTFIKAARVFTDLGDAVSDQLVDVMNGEAVHGDNAADWYKNAVAAAASYPSPPTRCDNPECEFHLGRE